MLLPERMHIFLGGTPAKRFAPDLAPVCGLQGTRADTFVSHHRQVPAAANYAAVLTERLRSNVVVVRGTELPGDEPALIW
ncbi:hypothetical protein ACFY2J_14335 [Streptomyces collinus]|uniref:hypothetical protein n=1 Tax=Streptomyces collinus TaxID=42684 RepID=UPI00368D61F3